MIERFRDRLADFPLLAPGRRALVAYSGGPDSTCLLDLLAQVKTGEIVAAHLHHGQREEADAEAASCAAYCASLGIEFVAEKADVPALAKRAKVGLEEAGRIARKEFLVRVMQERGLAAIVTGHTADDLLETVIFNLTRGTGLRGLAGILPVNGPFVRPMLSFTRAETRAYCEGHGLWFHDDPANVDLVHSRARIRHLVVPELERINPAVREAVGRMSESALLDETYLASLAASAREEARRDINPRLGTIGDLWEVEFDQRSLSSFPVPISARVLREEFRRMGGELTHETTALALAGSTRGSVTAEGGDVSASWDGDRIVIRRLRPPSPATVTLPLPGSADLPESGLRVSACLGPDVGREICEEVDFDAIQGTLTVRATTAQDEMLAQGRIRTETLHRLAKSRQVSEIARMALPVICDDLGPIWYPGVGLAQRVAKALGTTRVGRLTLACLGGTHKP